MSRMKLFIPLVIFAVLAGFLGWGLTLDPSHLPSALVDKPVPAFSLPVVGESEPTVTEESLKGTPYLLNVWATWCPSCRVEHPYLNKLAQQGVRIVGLDYKDEDQAALEWLEHFGNPYERVLADREGTLGLDLGVYGAPETFLVDKDGIIRYRHVGVVDERVWRSKLAPLFNQP